MVGCQRIGVEAQSTDDDARIGYLGLELVAITDGVDIDVGDTGVTPVGVAWWPAHQFDAVITQVTRGREHTIKRSVGKNGTDKAERELWNGHDVR